MSDSETTTTTDEALRRALGALRDLRGRLDRAERDNNEPIAVVGVGCRFPGGVESPDDLHELAVAGRDAVGQIPDDRPNLWAHYDPDPDVPGKIYTDRGGFLSQPIDEYDPAFFGIAGAEADFVDPQHRLLLEMSWEALEDAGVASDSLSESLTGVFMGISTGDYGLVVQKSRGNEPTGPYDGNGMSFSMAAGRLSHFFGFRGPAFAIDTACSSALVATSVAVESLRSGTSDLALAGGVNLIVDEQSTISMCATQALSPRGRCHTFTTEADGYVRAEGCGVLVLKRLSDAERDGDRIRAVVRSVSINHDGRSSGLTVPSGPAQQEAIRAALDRVGFGPGDVDYVEAHGTGTPLGDPIEVRAINAVYSEGRAKDDPLLLGSIKANVGHAEAAAGAAGLVKTIASLERGEIAPHLLHGEPTTHLDWEGMGVELVGERRAYPERDRPSRAAVSAFGLSGTNSHIILEAPPTPPSDDSVRTGPHVIALSAREDGALADLASAYAATLTEQPEALAELAWTSQVARSRFPSRIAVAAADPAGAIEALETFAAGDDRGVATGVAQSDPAVAFLFTGQGSQMKGMGSALYEAEPVFRDALDECAAWVRDDMSIDLLDLLFRDPADQINDTTFTQPALVALEFALARQWMAWGITPAVLAGHSIGEYAAAMIAGVVAPEDGMRLAAARGRLMGALPPGGGMSAVLTAKADVAAAIAGHPAVDLAAVNGPRASVIAGPESDLAEITAELTARDIAVRPLVVSHAFHSPLMEPMLADFRAIADTITFAEPTMPFVSAVTGRRERERFASAEYWVDHVRATVRFGDALEAVAADASTLLELGPRPVLSGFAANVVPDVPAVASMRPDQPEPLRLRQALGELWTHGNEPRWDAVGGAPGHRTDAPHYPFQRQRKWRDIPRRTADADRLHPLLHRRVLAPGLNDIVYESNLAADDPSYLGDHRILGEPVFPAAGYIEMMLVAARDAIGGGATAITELQVREMLVLPEDTDVLVATSISESGGTLRARVESLVDADAGTWRTHAEATVELRNAAPDVESIDLDALRADAEPVTRDRYQEFSDNGFDYGPVFRPLRESVTRPGLTVARVDVELPRPARDYHVHPALLDGCFQAVGDAVEMADLDTPDSVWVPVSIGEIELPTTQPTSGWVALHVELLEGELSASFTLYDVDGTVCGRITDLRSRQVAAEVVWDQVARARGDGGSALPHAHLLHETTWLELPAAVPVGSPGSWLVAGDAEATERLREAIGAAGGDCTVVEGTLPAASFDGMVVFAPGTASADAGTAAAPAVAAVHGLARQLATGDCPTTITGPVWVVTTGAFDVADQIPPVDPAQTAVAGYATALAAEMPNLGVRLLDLDPHMALDPDAVLLELLAGSDEDRTAHRAGARFGARLAPLSDREHHGLPTGPYELQLGERGTFGAIQFVEVDQPEPAADEVVIAVRASGLNFRDVLNVLGMYPGAPGVPGNECAGTVVAVGSDITEYAVGDEVVTMADGSFRRFAAVPQHLVFPLPPEVDHVSAATLPITFLTAHHGFHALAGLQAGQTVLVHSGAGGVGLSALQLARRAGATVIATAGSPAKRRYLRDLGATHVFDSRSLSFREQVLEATGGRGVDVALNSLADDFIPATLDCVAAGGVFLEIGKRGVWTDEQMADARPDVAYHLYDLGEEIRANPERLGVAMREILQLVASGELQALRRVTFPLPDVTAAFRYMAMARHVGKVVVTQPPHDAAAGTHVISGGHGALGLRTARELVEQGARHIALLSRRPPGPDAAAQIDELRALGAEVVSVAADAADRDGLADALTHIRDTMAPIRGVFHAAGVLSDGIVANLDDESFRTVNGPKIDGAWNLHVLTDTDPIERFVLYSSVAAQLGSPGQTNYAAANAFLDGLAHHRRLTGKPGLSIAWGPWAEIGMAAETVSTGRSSAAGAIDPDAGVAILTASAGITTPHLGVIPINWRRFSRQGGPGVDRPFFELVTAGADDAGAVVDLQASIASLESAEQRQVLRDAVRSTVAAVLVISPAGILDDQPFSELGLDSLLSVELGNRLQRMVGDRVIAPSAPLEFPTVELLADHLALEILDLDGSAPSGARTAITPVDRSTTQPASGVQNRLLFLDRFEPGLTIFNLSNPSRMRGAIRLDAIQYALDAIVERHEAIRTNFELVDGITHQVVAEPSPAPVTIEDRRGENLDRAAVIERIHEFSSEPFDLTSGIKLRALLIQTADDECYFAPVLHHIAGDGWSLAHLVAEFGELYEAHIQDREPALAPVEIQYLDYAHWLDEALRSEALGSQLDYWSNRLRGELPVLAFPTDFARPPARTYAAASHAVDLPTELVDEARAFAAGSDATLFVTLYASYAAALARYTGQEEIVVGTAVANRANPATAATVGFLANTVALRTNCDLEVPFGDLIGDVRRTVVDATTNQEIPFDQVVAEISPPRDVTRPPIYQTMFTLMNVEIPTVELEGVTIDLVTMEPRTIDYEIGVDLIERDGDLTVMMRYNTALFDADSVAQFSEHWINLLRDAVRRPEAPIGQLRLTAGDGPGVDAAGPDMAYDTDAKLHDLVAAQAAASPAATAIVAGEHRLTYAELDERVNRLTRHLLANGVEAEAFVGVVADRSIDMVIALLAALRAGAAYLPLDPAYPADRLRHMIEDSGSQTMIDPGGQLRAVIGDAGITVIDPIAEREHIDALAGDAPDAPAGDIAYSIYTSGSTGLPKGVVLEHRNVVNFLRSMQAEPGLTSDDVLLAVTTLSFDISVLELFLPLVVGATVVMAPPEVIADGRRLADLIADSGATVMQATPVTWNHLFDSGWAGAPGLKVLCGGEAMSRQLADRLLESCREVWNMFGPTETTVWSTVQRVEPGIAAISIGRPIANTVCEIVEPSGTPAPLGVPGELLIGGAGVARGYHDRPELNAERFIADPRRVGERLYRTGDLARWRRDGTIEFLGRLDHQVKVRGHRIELGEIEAALRTFDTITEAVVTARGSGADARIVGYVVVTDGAEPPTTAALRAHLQTMVPDYMVPSVFMVLDELPLTPNRKIDRGSLPAPDAALHAALSTYVEPDGDAEAVLTSLFGTVLDVERIGAESDFFESGGHSLQATTLLARVAAVFGWELDLRDFFADPTPRGVRRVLERLDGDPDRVEQIGQIERQVMAMTDADLDSALAEPADGPDGRTR